jgi:ankyrin repeat protein
MAWNALHALAGYNSVDELRREIAEGLDIDEADEDGLTPLHHACIEKSYEAARVLVEAGAAVDPQDKWGNTPLNRAVFEDAVELVQLLIDHGADPTIDNNYGHSPLSEAKRHRKAEYLAVMQRADPANKSDYVWTRRAHPCTKHRAAVRAPERPSPRALTSTKPMPTA